MRRDALDPFAQVAAAAGAGKVMILDGARAIAIHPGEPTAPTVHPGTGDEFVARAEAEAVEAGRRALDARERAQAASEEARMQRIEAGLAELKDALLQVVAGQRKIEDLLGMDVVAEYDEKGRVTRAHREPRKGS